MTGEACAPVGAESINVCYNGNAPRDATPTGALF